MNRVGFIADVHLGNHQQFGGALEAGINRRGRLVLDALRRAVADVLALEGAGLVVAGDLFDTSKPNPQTLTAVQKILEDEWVCLMLGNHDRNSGQRGDHALGPLQHLIVDRTSCIIAPDLIPMLILPFRPEPVMSWLEAELMTDRVIPMASAHFGLHDAVMRQANPWCEKAPDAAPVEEVLRLCKQAGVKILLAGNWHQHRVWEQDGVTVIQIGALVPTGWDNPGLDGYGSVVMVDGQCGWDLARVSGPRFLNVHDQQEFEASLLRAEGTGDQLFVRWHTDQAGAKFARSCMEGHPRFEGWEVVLDRAEAEKRAGFAARSARSAETLEQAAMGYVQQMSLPEDVDRRRVWERVKGLLG